MWKKMIEFFVPAKVEVVPTEKEKVAALLQYYADNGEKPAINRTTDKWQGYGSEVTKKKNFIKVRNGHQALYFGNPFWNLYRINSRAGTKDFVTHSV